MWNVDAFAQDSWKLRTNLTLEYGVRGGYWTNNVELNGLGAWFDPARYDPTRPAWLDESTFQQLNGVCYVSSGCTAPGIFANRRPFAMPRVNVAWDIAGNGTNVLRGGYGVFFNRPPGNVEYSVMGMPPALHQVTQDAYGGFGYGDGVGLTYDTARETTLASQQGRTGISTFTPRSFAFPKVESFSVSYARRPLLQPGHRGCVCRHEGSAALRRNEHEPRPGRCAAPGLVGNADLAVPVNRVALDAVAVNKFRPYQVYSSLQSLDFAGVSNQDSLQVTLSRQSGRRLQVFRRIHAGPQPGHVWRRHLLLSGTRFDQAECTGYLNTDRTHTLTVSWNAMLPDGAPRPAAARGSQGAL